MRSMFTQRSTLKTPENSSIRRFFGPQKSLNLLYTSTGSTCNCLSHVLVPILWFPFILKNTLTAETKNEHGYFLTKKYSQKIIAFFLDREQPHLGSTI